MVALPFGGLSGLHYCLVLPYKQVQRIMSQCDLHVPGSSDGPQIFVSINRANCWGTSSIVNVGRLRLLSLILF